MGIGSSPAVGADSNQAASWSPATCDAAAAAEAWGPQGSPCNPQSPSMPAAVPAAAAAQSVSSAPAAGPASHGALRQVLRQVLAELTGEEGSRLDHYRLDVQTVVAVAKAEAAKAAESARKQAAAAAAAAKAAQEQAERLTKEARERAERDASASRSVVRGILEIWCRGCAVAGVFGIDALTLVLC